MSDDTWDDPLWEQAMRWDDEPGFGIPDHEWDPLDVWGDEDPGSALSTGTGQGSSPRTPRSWAGSFESWDASEGDSLCEFADCMSERTAWESCASSVGHSPAIACDIAFVVKSLRGGARDNGQAACGGNDIVATGSGEQDSTNQEGDACVWNGNVSNPDGDRQGDAMSDAASRAA